MCRPTISWGHSAPRCWPRCRDGLPVTRYVLTPDVALLLARDRVVVPHEHALVAPALMRSQLVSLLYRAAARGEVTEREARAQLDHVRTLRLRLLGDRVLQATAWSIAAELGWPDTLDAEYVAVTRLQADALVTLDTGLATQVSRLVEVTPVAVLLPD